MTRSRAILFVIVSAGLTGSCVKPEGPATRADAPPVAGTEYVVRDTTIAATLESSGVAEPLRESTLSTSLMGTLVAVLVQEGDAVAEGQVLARIDARALEAKRSQLAAALAEAEAVRNDARTQLARMRALYADSAATRAQLDAAETGFARAEAGVRSVQAGSAELDAVSDYATVRAPFAGTITRRFLDPGSFVAPGTPIVAVQDASRLRLRASVAPDLARGLHRGQSIGATIEGQSARAVIEGIVPGAGNIHVVNAVVDNRARQFLAGSAATLGVPLGQRSAVVIPAAALRHEGDLTGVILRTATGEEVRWIRVARGMGELVEVTAGLRAGDRVVVPIGGGSTVRATPKER